MMSIFSVSVFVALFTGNFAQWTYSDLDEWGGVCQTGERQSPIELSRKSAMRSSIPPLKLNNYRSAFGMTLKNNGHTVEVRIIDTDRNGIPILSGGNLEKYVLDNIHFHWDSEHTINSKRYDLEAHLVHYKTEYGNVSTASGHPDGIVVLAVLFEQSLHDNKKLNNLIDATRIVARNVDARTDLKGLEIDDILPKNTKSFYKYDGSLTTPECNEVVTWIVFDSTVDIGKSQLNELYNVVSSTGEPLTKNFRPLQDLNCREVFHS